MAQNVTLNGTSYSTPDIGEAYGASFTNYLRALSSDSLTKDGGTRTLLADLNLGANYGLVAKYVKSNALTISTAGILRLGNNESIGWRNAGNTTNYELKVNASNVLEFNGNPVFTLALGAVDTVLRMNGAGTAYEYAKLVNANIDAAAAIDATKIADGSVTSTEFQYINTLSSNAQTQLDSKVAGPASATDNALVRFDATTGKLVKNSPVIVDDSGNMSGVANLTLSGNIDKASAASLDIGGTNATTINIGRSGQTTVIKGNFQVDGTTTTVNSTVMEVADANVRVNNGGNDASAEGAGLTIEGTSNSDLATIQYATALASKFKAGASGSESEIITAGTTQTITGAKTFTENVIVDNSKEIRFEEATANGDNYIGLKASSSLSASTTFTLPTADGSANQVLNTNGSGQLGWSTVVAADANNNIAADNFISGFTTTATAAGTTTLTVNSTEQQEFTGTTTQTVTMPTTSIVAGTSYKIINNSTGVVTVQSSGANTIMAMPANSTITLTALVATPTTAAHWDISSSVGAYPANSTGATPAAGTIGERKTTALTTNMSTPATAGNYQDSSETLSLETGVWNLRFRGSITMTSGASVGSTLDHRVEIQITDASNNIIARCATGARFTGASQTQIQSFEFGDIVYPTSTTSYKIRVRTNHNNDASGVNGIIYSNNTVLSGAVVQETRMFATRIT